jgi:ribonuclease BN (tRNA processing enzyme)
MKLTVIGCSGLFPSPISPASGYLVEANDAGGRTWRVMLDLGSGALGPLQQLVELASLDAVLLSNLEIDHCADLSSLYIALRYAPSGPYRIAVYGPPGTMEHLIEICGSEYKEEVSTVYEVSEWADRRSVVIGPLTITPVRVAHPGQAFGLRIEDANAVVAYTGDTETCPALTDLASKADLLLAEATQQGESEEVRKGHMTGQQAGVVAANARVTRLVITHMPVWVEKQTILAAAEASFTGSVQLAESNAVYDIP